MLRVSIRSLVLRGSPFLPSGRVARPAGKNMPISHNRNIDIRSCRLYSTGVPEATSKLVETSTPLLDPVVPWDGPINVVVNLLETFHNLTGLPWWITIVGSVVFYRSILLTVFVPQMRNFATLELISPTTQRIRAQITAAKKAKMNVEKRFHQEALKQHFKTHGVHPMRSFVTPMVYLPFYYFTVQAIRRMVELFPSFSEGGVGYIENLAQADPYHILPVLGTTVLALLAVVRLSPFARPPYKPGRSYDSPWTLFLLSTALSYGYVSWDLPAAPLLFAVTSLSWTLAQQLLFIRSRTVRLFFKIPTGSLDSVETKFEKKMTGNDVSKAVLAELDALAKAATDAREKEKEEAQASNIQVEEKSKAEQ